MISQDVIFSDHGPSVFGKDYQLSWTKNSNKMELKMHTFQCLYQKKLYKLKKSMLKDLHQKLLGLQNQEILTNKQYKVRRWQLEIM